MQLVKLALGHIRLGEPLAFAVRDAGGRLLLARGQVLDDSAQVEALLARDACVEAGEMQALLLSRRQAAGADDEPKRPDTLFTRWQGIVPQLDALLRSLAEAGFATRADELARHIVSLIERDADIAIYLSVRPDARGLSNYGLTHAVHCAVIGLLMARRIGWDERRTLTLMKAALTMNLAAVELQSRLALQGEPPTSAQRATLRAHPQQAGARLRAAGVDDSAWLQAIEQHHERADGSGYPQGLTQICEMAQALRLVDVFMAKISERSDRAPLALQLAARQLFQESGGSPAAAAIIKELGIYPPGALVQLASGECAIVVRRGPTATTPLVGCITDRNGAPIVDTPTRDTAEAAFAIVGTGADKSLARRVLPERFYGLPAA